MGTRPVTFQRGFSQFMALCHRNAINNIKNPGIFWVRFIMYAFLCLMIGLMYLNLGDEYSSASINSRLGVLFYLAAFLIFMSVAVLPFFIMERPVFLRERLNGAYGVIPYMLAQYTCALPGIFLIALASTVCA